MQEKWWIEKGNEVTLEFVGQLTHHEGFIVYTSDSLEEAKRKIRSKAVNHEGLICFLEEVLATKGMNYYMEVGQYYIRLFKGGRYPWPPITERLQYMAKAFLSKELALEETEKEETPARTPPIGNAPRLSNPRQER